MVLESRLMGLQVGACKRKSVEVADERLLLVRAAILIVLRALLLDLLFLGVRALIALVVLGTTIEALVVARRETTVLERAVCAVLAANS